MAQSGNGNHHGQGEPALAGSPPADRRSDQPEIDPLEPPEVDPEDTTTILDGNQAITGRAASSANRMMASQQADETRRAAEKHKADREAQQRQELVNLAQWNKKDTVVGGVKMTNEQAQKARQQFLDHEDEYADEAAKAGLIREDQKDALKAGMRRKVELQDKVGRGIATDDDRKELKNWDQSDLGKAGDKITADIHQGKGLTTEARATLAGSTVSMASERTVSAAGVDDKFQTAPVLTATFAEKSNPDDPVPTKPATPAPSTKKLEATGADF